MKKKTLYLLISRHESVQCGDFIDDGFYVFFHASPLEYKIVQNIVNLVTSDEYYDGEFSLQQGIEFVPVLDMLVNETFLPIRLATLLPLSDLKDVAKNITTSDDAVDAILSNMLFNEVSSCSVSLE